MKLLTFFLFSLVCFGQAQRIATVTWEDTRNPTGTTYSVYRATGLCSGSPVFSKIATGVTAKTYDDVGISPGGYCYQVTASLNNVESAPSNSAPATVTPFEPQNLRVQVP